MEDSMLCIKLVDEAVSMSAGRASACEVLSVSMIMNPQIMQAE